MDSLLRYAIDGSDKRTIRIETAHIFPVSVSEGFAYITDTNNWKAYWPGFVRVKDSVGARWGQAGDTIVVVVKLLNRERDLNMVLAEYKPHTLVTYVSRQQGLPDAHHERHFHALPQGFEYRLLVSYVPRPGLAGVFDKTLVRRAVTRTLTRTIRNLEAVFKQW